MYKLKNDFAWNYKWKITVIHVYMIICTPKNNLLINYVRWSTLQVFSKWKPYRKWNKGLCTLQCERSSLSISLHCWVNFCSPRSVMSAHSDRVTSLRWLLYLPKEDNPCPKIYMYRLTQQNQRIDNTGYSVDPFIFGRFKD